jgi:phosphatidate cytidylyltransferase
MTENAVIVEKTSEETAAKKPDSSFQTRLKSALIFAPLVLAVLYFGGGAFTLMMALASAIGVQEWSKMALTGQTPHKVLIPLAACLTGLTVAASGLVGNPATTLWLLFGICFLVFSFNFSNGNVPIRRVIFGIIYIGFSIDIMIWIRNSPDNEGLYDMLTLLLMVWASDIAAYFSGKAIGGPKLAPLISPKKTWAGFIGSSIGAGAVAAGLASPWLLEQFALTTIGGLSVVGYGVMGFFLAMVGQAGDLFISMLKRHYGVKDTGTLIPGHGGILDRIDALLLVAIFFGTLMVALGR